MLPLFRSRTQPHVRFLVFWFRLHQAGKTQPRSRRFTPPTAFVLQELRHRHPRPPPRFVLAPPTSLLLRGLEQAGGGLAVWAHLSPPGGAEPLSVAAVLMRAAVSMVSSAHISAGNGLAGRPRSRRQRLTCDLRVHAELHHHRMSRETKPGAGDPEAAAEEASPGERPTCSSSSPLNG